MRVSNPAHNLYEIAKTYESPRNRSPIVSPRHSEISMHKRSRAIGVTFEEPMRANSYVSKIDL